MKTWQQDTRAYCWGRNNLGHDQLKTSAGQILIVQDQDYDTLVKRVIVWNNLIFTTFFSPCFLTFSWDALKQLWTTWIQCLGWSSRWTTTLKKSRNFALPCSMKTSVPHSSTSTTSWEHLFAHWEWYWMISSSLVWSIFFVTTGII